MLNHLNKPFNTMQYQKKLLIVFLLFSFSFFSQEKFTLSGTIYDAENNETLIGVSIYFPDLEIGTTTNEYGFYSITLPQGNQKIQISYLGFKTIVKTLSISEKLTKDFKLEIEAESLDEIVIEANVEQLNVKLQHQPIQKVIKNED